MELFCVLLKNIHEKHETMITVKVTYTVQAEFAQANIANVNTFMRALRALNNPAIRYVSYLGEDGKPSPTLHNTTTPPRSSSCWPRPPSLNSSAGAEMPADWRSHSRWR